MLKSRSGHVLASRSGTTGNIMADEEDKTLQEYVDVLSVAANGEEVSMALGQIIGPDGEDNTPVKWKLLKARLLEKAAQMKVANAAKTVDHQE
jgi:hypothetical protein